MSTDAVTTFKVPTVEPGERADKLLTRYHPNVSRSQIQKAFKNGQVRCNGVVITPKCRAAGGDTFEWVAPQKRSSQKLTPVPLPLDILYEDTHVIALNKASGQVVHPGNGTGTDTLVHALLHHCGEQLSHCGEAARPGIVHRLDKETSGVLIVAKTELAYQRLIQIFAQRTVKKEYLALVRGIPSLSSGTIRKPIARHPKARTHMCIVEEGGRPAQTDWHVEMLFGNAVALLRCFPVTGRTHQIRVHLSTIGHPILGDRTYGCCTLKRLKVQPSRVQLHAHRLELRHPVTGKHLALEAPPARDFSAFVDACHAL